jgi:hypothetical protein
MSESVSTDFHKLPTGGCARQEFIPPIQNTKTVSDEMSTGPFSCFREMLTHAHVGVYNVARQGACMENLQRVNLLLEKRQRQALERLARQRNRSVSDLVREYITAGLREDNSQQRERILALENARALKIRVMKRRKKKPAVNTVKVMEQMREERVNELLGRRR